MEPKEIENQAASNEGEDSEEEDEYDTSDQFARLLSDDLIEVLEPLVDEPDSNNYSPIYPQLPQ